MLRIWPLVGATTLLAVLALACNGNGEGTPSTQDETTSLEPTPMRYAERPELTIDPDKKYTAIIETEKGTFRIQLKPDLAIQTVNSFVFLAREGYYDGVTFHRVIPGFVAQGGDPTGTGSGSPGYTLPAEFSDVPFERGTVAMARTDDPDSAGSQFFIVHQDSLGLDGQFSVFGRVVEGIAVVDAITEVEIDTYGRYGPIERPHPVAVVIDSPGGDAKAAFQIASLLRRH